MTGHILTRSAVGSLPPTPLDPKERPRPRMSSLDHLQSRLQRGLSRNRSIRSDTSKNSQTPVDAKGALGLNLLQEPSEPQIDFVFIHGLGGGSKKTWSYSAEPGMFWPKEWLPTEAGFKHVRLHSYGYNSDWTSRGDSSLTVHDFGQALLADLHNSPYLRKGGETPIVLVAHSMGGLVAKKAYLLATRDPVYQSTARRIKALYFLATPHRGADSANLTKLVRQYSGFGPKAFLNDLLPGSGTLDQINDEFRHVCGDVKLWSFSEAIPTTFGLTSSMVVEKDSAILSLPNERVQYIEADHRHICKFDSRNDPNYLILQRAFLTTIEDLDTGISSQRCDEYRSQMKKVASLLRVDQRPDATLLATNEKQHAGSCEWITEHPTFQKWIDRIFDDWKHIDHDTGLSAKSVLATPPVLWLHGRPGTGKSVAAGHVIRYLQSRNFDCSFYFFRHQDSASLNIASLLRSLAFQMAETNVEIRRAVVSMTNDSIRINTDDHLVLWNSLFIQRIFEIGNVGPQHWVIDGVDECSNKAIPALISIVSSLGSKVPVRVFMTSRPGGEVGKRMSAAQPETPFLEMTTGGGGTLKDIELFLQSRYARSGDTSAYGGLVSDVLAKSNGIFLWASLTIEKLEDAYSVEDKQDVLRQIPPEMEGFYSRIITSIAESPSAELAKGVLTWVMCSPKPLHVSELAEAVKMDLGRTLTASARQLETMTGHFIIIDNLFRVHIGHETMSRYLMQPNNHGLWVDHNAAETHISEICIKVLCGPEFAPPRVRKGRPAIARDAAKQSHFANYAALNFSHHLINGSHSANTTLLLLNKFLRSNVLTWIERIATTGSLWYLQQTVQRFKAYLSRRAKDQLPDTNESQTIAAWASDIYHIIVAFGSNLVTSPSCIYSLIPFLCPPRSIIRELFAKPGKRLQIAGPMEDDWNDRVACCLLPEPSSVAYSSRFLAIGLRSGDIMVYNFGESATFDAICTLEHGRIVRQLAFNCMSTMLASASPRMLKLWDLRVTGESGLQCLWSTNLDFTPFSLAFTPNDASIALINHGYSAIVTFDVSDGERQELLLLHSAPDSDPDSVELSAIDRCVSDWSPAERMYLDPHNKLAAMGYRNAVVTIWDLEAMECIGNYETEGTEGVYCTPPSMSMVFNPLLELKLLAISYKNGDLVTCNPWTLETESVYSADALLDSLTATSDGRILAGAAEDASIYLFLFETLQPIYRIPKPDGQFRVNGLAFSADNLRLFDIRYESCNVWEPQALVPRDGADDTSLHTYNEVLVPAALSAGAHAFQWEEGITVIETALESKVLFVGRKDGTIDICEASTGEAVEKLRLHHYSADIHHLEWNELESCLLSLDRHGRYRVSRLSSFGKKGTKAEVVMLLDGRDPHIVRQAFLGPEATSVLICTDLKPKLIGIDGEVFAEETTLTGKSSWSRHPANPNQLIAIQDGTAHLFDWVSLKPLTAPGGVTLQPAAPEPTRMVAATYERPWVCNGGSSFIAAQGLLDQSQAKFSNLVAFDATKLNGDGEEITSHVLNTHVDHLRIEQLLGFLRSSLFFLDAGGWVCSINPKTMEETTHYTRHFFIPPTWRTGCDDVVKIISKSAVAFGRGEQLIVFHGFLEFEEKVPLKRAYATI